ncbi:hypothetical protein F5883DRAFT_582025 [Diaporthe sp. PMI_573]|nr:hypothetical protein F5883DRAFT_582025 [Diaporthaceae sp. PMI_573]
MYLLDKPVFVKNVRDGRLAEDIRPLHDRIQYINNFRIEVFPGELRAKVEAVETQLLPPNCFREADPGGPSHQTLATFAGLCRIIEAAEKSRKLRRYEDAWNNLVHTPLLDLAFGLQPLEMEKQEQREAVSVRFEPVMSATISYEWIPRLDRGSTSQEIKQQTNLSDLACSVTAGSAVSSASEGSADASHVSVPKDLMHTRTDSKKVDYVLVLDVADGVPLKTVISDLTLRAALDVDGFLSRDTPPPHVNQTTYQPIRDSPIAVSIETKQDYSSRDPLLQLGIWVAAWHRRMRSLYSARALALLDEQFQNASTSDDPPSSGPQNAVPARPKVVSLPLIVVTGHEWQIYFACDQDTSIEVYGPLRMGSTATLLDVYALLSSLLVVKEWIETTFYQALRDWFQCGE